MTPIRRDLTCSCGLRLHRLSLRHGHRVCSRCRERDKGLARARRHQELGRFVGEWVAKVVL